MPLTLQDALDSGREIYVTIRVATDPSAWGEECDEDLAQQAAELHAERLAKWAREQWPQDGVFTSSEFVYDTLTNPAKATTSGADGWHVREIEDAIYTRMCETWTDDLQAAVDEGGAS